MAAKTVGEMKPFVFFTLVALTVCVGTVIVLALVKMVPDTKQAGTYRLKLGGGVSKKNQPAPTV